MDIKEFERTVALGLGRAVLSPHEESAELYRDVILDACLHNKASDPQIEGSRAEYVIELMRSTADVAFFSDAVLAALTEEAGDWDTWQRFRIARLLAQEGNQRARRAMRAGFDSSPESMVSIFAEEFIELDGLDGLLYVVGRRGEQLRLNNEKWEDDNLLSVAADKCVKRQQNSRSRALQRPTRTQELTCVRSRRIERKEKNASASIRRSELTTRFDL